MKTAIRLLTLLALLALTLGVVTPAYADTHTVTNNSDSGTDSLRDAIATAVDGDTIMFAGDYTITLSSELVISKDLTIDGAGHKVTVSGGDATRVFNVTAGNITFNHLTIADGNTQTTDCGSGGAVKCGGGLMLQGSSTVVTVTDSAFSGNSAAYYGGGIYNDSNATLTITNSTFFSNTAVYGGGIFTYGELTVTNSTFSGNEADYGGGILTQCDKTQNITNSTFSGNIAHDRYGGGIVINSGTLNVTNSTFSGNIAQVGSSPSLGGAIYNGSTLNVTNSTFSGNSAQGGGGGAIYNDKTMNATNSTFSGNTADKGGGGIYDASAAATTLKNVIIDNSTSSGSNCYSPPTDGGGNLENRNDCGFTQPTSITNTNPLLGNLGNYGGSTQTFPLLPGSPAIDAGVSGCGSTDQRGVARVSTCDSGAFESQGFTLAKTGGDNQTTLLNTAFTDPLALSVTSSFSEPVNGGQVTFAGPLTGVSTNPITNTATIASGAVSVTATANGTVGSYNVTASATGAADVFFALTNKSSTTTTTLNSSLNPSGYGESVTFTATIAPADATGTVTFQYGVSNILGCVAVSVSSGEATCTTSTLAIGTHTITAGYSSNSAYLDSTGTLSPNQEVLACMHNIIVANNADSDPGSLRQAITDVCPGGTIRFDNDYTIPLSTTLTIGASMTIDGAGHSVSVSGDNAVVVFTINSSLTFNLQNITVKNGRNTSSTGGGGGLSNTGGTVHVTNSTFSGNSAVNDGGGILNKGTLEVTNSTFSGNSAGMGGGGLWSFSLLTVTNSTFSGNSAGLGGGGGLRNNSHTATVKNTILANNVGGNCFIQGTLTDGGGNLEDSTSCGFSAATSKSNTNPLLGALGNHGGDTPTFALLSGSPAIDAGADCPATDQRGEARDDLQCDIGAYELKYDDSPTVIRPVSSTITTTFGPALGGILRDAGYIDPGVITVTKEAWSRQGSESIGTLWAITPTETSGFSLTLQLCYTDAELRSLTESALRFYRSDGITYTQLITTPVLSTVNGYHCAALSGITALSRWTLATDTPTAVTLERLAASASPIDLMRPIGVVALIAAVAAVFASGGRAAWLRRRARREL